MSCCRLLLLSLLTFASGVLHADTRALLQMVDYVGVDYPEAVADGEIVDEFEYREMVEFAARIRQGVDELPATDASTTLAENATALATAIERRAAPEEVAAITRTLRDLMMASYDLELVPRTRPELERARAVYASQCAACHGAAGHGDGQLAAGMEPAPTDFHDAARARERSLFGLYNTITLGVEGTPMPGFSHVTDAERWALAFLVGGFYAEPGADAAVLWEEIPLTLEQAVTATPAELAARIEGGEQLALLARHQPALLFPENSEALLAARDGIRAAVAHFDAGDAGAARDAAIRAYLEGFELAEAALAAVDRALMLEIETAMMDFRRLLGANADPAIVAAEAAHIEALLEQADLLLGGDTLSPGVAYASALVILLREGLEAILVIAAMAAFLSKTGRREGLPWLHAGWVLAVLAGAGTWVVSTHVLTISGATRELTEGFTALFAAGILFYVGFWMHSRASAEGWNRYIQQRLGAALGRGTLWSLALVAFLAVYREMFETILFYQALWTQVTSDAHDAVLGGAATAIALLALVTLAIFRFGMRLPLARFFAITAWLMIALAVIFAGKGVAALQEAGRLTVTPVNFPRIDLLGIHPSAEGLALQAVVLALAVWLMWRQARRRPNSAAA